MGIVWALVGAGAAGMALGIALLIFALSHRRGKVFGILGGVALILAALILLACYLPVFVVPDVAANSAVFNGPAPVDASATVFYLSPAEEGALGTPHASNDTLIAVAARTGAIRWQRALPGTVSSYVTDGDAAYVATARDRSVSTFMLAAYRASDGALLWQTALAGGLLGANLAADGGRVYVPVAVNEPQPQIEIVALRASDGAQLMSIGTGLSLYASLTLTAAPDAVYLDSGNGVQVYRASDGKPLWQDTQVEPGPRLVLPVVANGVVYLAGAGEVLDGIPTGGLSAVRASDGTTICAASHDLVVHAIALGGNTVYVAAERPGPSTDGQARLVNPETVYAYDATTCAPLWQYATTSSNGAQALIAGNNAVYIGADDGISALRAADGNVLWHRGPAYNGIIGGGWMFAQVQPAVLGSTLFVTAPVLSGGIVRFDGRVHLYAFGGADGSDYWNVPVGHRTTFSWHQV